MGGFERNNAKREKKEKRDREIKRIDKGWLYVIECDGFSKIGKTINPKSRTAKYISENPHEISVKVLIEVEHHSEKEEALHKMFNKKLFRGEWFKLDNKDFKTIKRYLNK